MSHGNNKWFCRSLSPKRFPCTQQALNHFVSFTCHKVLAKSVQKGGPSLCITTKFWPGQASSKFTSQPWRLCPSISNVFEGIVNQYPKSLLNYFYSLFRIQPNKFLQLDSLRVSAKSLPSCSLRAKIVASKGKPAGQDPASKWAGTEKLPSPCPKASKTEELQFCCGSIPLRALCLSSYTAWIFTGKTSQSGLTDSQRYPHKRSLSQLTRLRWLVGNS